MKKILVAFTIVTTLLACEQEGRVFSEHKELSPELEWLKKDVREFKVPVTDHLLLYNLSLSFRFTSGYQYEIAKVKVTETSPSGEEKVYEYDLKVREANGDYIGEPGLDIWDSEHMVEFNKKYSESGTYTYVIEHIMPNDPLNFVMEIGVILDQAM